MLACLLELLDITFMAANFLQPQTGVHQMSIALKIAFLRAKMVARRSLARAVQILQAAGIAFNAACSMVLEYRWEAKHA